MSTFASDKEGFSNEWCLEELEQPLQSLFDASLESLGTRNIEDYLSPLTNSLVALKRVRFLDKTIVTLI